MSVNGKDFKEEDLSTVELDALANYFEGNLPEGDGEESEDEEKKN
jgi:hypothetical protein